MWVDAGSRDEKSAGTSLLLQKLNFHGTKKRSQKQLESDIANLGGHFTAHTTREQTVYSATVLKKDVAQAVEIISDIVQNSIHDEVALNTKARDAVVRDLEKAYDCHEWAVLDHLHETAFHSNGLGRIAQNSIDNIGNVTRADIQSFVGSYYTANRIVVAGAGAVEHKQLVDLSEKHFSGLANSRGPNQETAVFRGSDKRIRFDSMNVTFPLFRFDDRNDFVFLLACTRGSCISKCFVDF